MSDAIRWSDLDDEQNLTVDQLSQYTGISTSALNKARMEPGKGPEFWKMGGSVRYQVGKVREWIRQNTQASTRLRFAFGSLDDNELPDTEEMEEWLN